MATHPASDFDWKTVVNTKKIKRDAKIQALKRERVRWAAILDICPHVVTPRRAQRLRRRLNVAKLDERLLSEEWIEYQTQGWEYVKVLKPQDSPESPESEGIEYSTLEVDNGWEDKVLFSRTTKTCRELPE